MEIVVFNPFKTRKLKSVSVLEIQMGISKKKNLGIGTSIEVTKRMIDFDRADPLGKWN